MLIKYSINNQKFYDKPNLYKILDVTEIQEDILELIINGVYDFTQNKQIVLNRHLDDGDTFVEKFDVVDSRINGNTTIIKIKYYNLHDYILSPSSINTHTLVKKENDGKIEYEREGFKYCFENADFIDTAITFDSAFFLEGVELCFEKDKHICIEDRGLVDIKSILLCGENFESIENGFCGGYILYDNRILYEASKNITYANIKNIITHKLKYNNKEYDVIIPFSGNGYDNRRFMFVYNIEDEVFDISKTFKTEDCRFFYRKSGKLYPHNNTVLYANIETLNITVPSLFDFSNDLYHDILLEDYVDEIKERYVTKPLDYEKQMFAPIYINNKVKKELKSIRFNIFLRQHHFFEETMEWKLASLVKETVKDEDLNEIEVDVWKPDNDTLWNSYSGGTEFLYSGYTSNTGDILGDLGFDDNDVYNRNKRLAKTFIRLLFFDKKDRNTQTLLFYSTIFLDTTALYNKYMNNIKQHTKFYNKDVEEFEYVYNVIENEKLREELQLSCNFTCYDKNNMSGSSEGYYLYLFPSLLDTLEDEDNITGSNGEKRIFMRVEFNHAKYGQTIPLLYVKNGEFPKVKYDKKVVIDGAETTSIFTDLTSLYNDMYIPIIIKYDTDLKRYVYRFENTDVNINNPCFNMWEPKVR